MIKTEYRKIKDLKKLPNNPRIIKDLQFQQLCKSIKDNPDYFEARPCILSDRTGEFIIIAGNQRYEAAKTLGLKQIPTVLIPDLTEQREKEIIVRDNVSNGSWDYDLLANEWEVTDLQEWGIDLQKLDLEENKKETKEIKSFIKTHVLISFAPEKILELKPFLDSILQIDGIDHEQSSN